MSDSSPAPSAAIVDTAHQSRCATLRHALTTRVVIADGAMGTMLQAATAAGIDGHPPLVLQDYRGLEGCNEIVNLTRPDVVAAIHRRYLQAGAQAVKTNTFGANYSNLADYQISDQVEHLALAGARIARACADQFATAEQPRWVLGSMGPGTKLPSLGQVPFTTLRQAYCAQTRGLLAGGADALLIETCQDLLQAKAAILGARDALAPFAHLPAEHLPPLIVSVTVETTGTLLIGSDIGAVVAVLDGLGVEVIGLNCATGPEQMGEHLRTLSGQTRAQLACQPNAGLPVLGPDGASYPLHPQPFAQALSGFVQRCGVSMVGGCCGTTPEHIAALAQALAQQQPCPRQLHPSPALASLYSATTVSTAHPSPVTSPAATDYWCVGERANANGSKAFRDALLAEDLQRCVQIALDQQASGSHLLDVCVDYVGRPGQADMAALVAQLSTAVQVPLMLDSTEAPVLQAGLEHYGGRAVLNSVNYEDGDGPDSRFARTMALAAEHGCAVVALTIDESGQARTCEHKLAVAHRLMAQLTGDYGMDEADIFLDCLTFPIATGQEETRRDGLATLQAIAALRQRYPRVGLVLGVSNISFGLNPAARQVLNSVFLAQAVQAGLSAAIVNPAAILPLAQLQQQHHDAALDLINDRRDGDSDPLTRFMECFAGSDVAQLAVQRDNALMQLPLRPRIRQRIIDGKLDGLGDDLDQALAQAIDPLALINEDLLDGMREVGQLFGSGQMQLPFVLQSAQVMKAAVRHLQPHLEQVADADNPATRRGTLVLATVRGDVHDIGKNLVEIIVSNNGYRVINLGIKQPMSAIIDAAIEHEADVIGMSGLLVKSTVIMKENLQELTQRGLAGRWPILLGGAALTRPYVEDDLDALFPGVVRYARDAFEGLALLGPLVQVARGVPDAQNALPALRKRRVAAVPNSAGVATAAIPAPRRSVEPVAHLPTPPWWGSKVSGVGLDVFADHLDQRALFQGQWGLRANAQTSYEQLVASDGLPRLEHWLDYLHAHDLVDAGVVYGFFPCASDGEDLLIFGVDAAGNPLVHEPAQVRWNFPRQTRDAQLCLSDYWRNVETVRADGQPDVVALQLVTVGSLISEECQQLFAQDRYRDYLELHGLSVQLAEALAEYWHAQMRSQLGIAAADAPDLAGLLRQHYQGARYSFGYPACPDLAARQQLVALLEPHRIGVTLSAQHQLHPEQSTDALIAHHSAAVYFSTTGAANAV